MAALYQSVDAGGGANKTKPGSSKAQITSYL
jgi:hypothetical protein